MNQDQKSAAIIIVTVFVLALFAATLGYDMYQNNKSSTDVLTSPVAHAPTTVQAPTKTPVKPMPTPPSQVVVGEEPAPAVRTTSGVYISADKKVQFSYPAGVTIDDSSITNDIRIVSVSDAASGVKVQINRYASLSQLGDYADLKAYLKDRQKQGLMTDLVKTKLDAEVAYKFTDVGISKVFTILVQHADGSIHIVLFPNHETRVQLSAAEVALMLSISFLK
ncbi:MAG: hypothetical protein AAB870_04920 [Patescibacteria group bacterium]